MSWQDMQNIAAPKTSKTGRVSVYTSKTLNALMRGSLKTDAKDNSMQKTTFQLSCTARAVLLAAKQHPKTCMRPALVVE